MLGFWRIWGLWAGEGSLLTQDRQSTKHKCLISSRFQSLTRLTGEASAADTDCCPQMHQSPFDET